MPEQRGGRFPGGGGRRRRRAVAAMSACPDQATAVALHNLLGRCPAILSSCIGVLPLAPASAQAYLDLASGDMDAADAAAEEQAKPRIEFPEQEEAAREQTRLEAERAKHKQRCKAVQAGSVPQWLWWCGGGDDTARWLQRGAGPTLPPPPPMPPPAARPTPPSPPLCCRAEKFGVEYVEPAQRRDLRLDARKERLTRPTMGTGFDPFTEEEAAKRAQRAGRFGLPEGSGLAWKPPVVTEDEEKKRQRAARFGVDYQPKDGTGLMDVGERVWSGLGRRAVVLCWGHCCRSLAASLALAPAVAPTSSRTPHTPTSSPHPPAGVPPFPPAPRRQTCLRRGATPRWRCPAAPRPSTSTVWT